MIDLIGGLKIFFCTEPTNMRRSFYGLSSIVQRIMKLDPLSGHLFGFRNRSSDSIKILYWDRDGLALWYKRLDEGTFHFPTVSNNSKDAATASAEMSESDRSLLLSGIDLQSVRLRERYSLGA